MGGELSVSASILSVAVTARADRPPMVEPPYGCLSSWSEMPSREASGEQGPPTFASPVAHRPAASDASRTIPMPAATYRRRRVGRSRLSRAGEARFRAATL